jgi:nitric oxide reductase NorD protein
MRRRSSRPGARRLLLILTDGKPNDLDTRRPLRIGPAYIIEAVAWAHAFCVTIDETPEITCHTCSAAGYVVVHDAAMLPQVLPSLYTRLTENI